MPRQIVYSQSDSQVCAEVVAHHAAPATEVEAWLSGQHWLEPSADLVLWCSVFLAVMADARTEICHCWALVLLKTWLNPYVHQVYRARVAQLCIRVQIFSLYRVGTPLFVAVYQNNPIPPSEWSTLRSRSSKMKFPGHPIYRSPSWLVYRQTTQQNRTQRQVQCLVEQRSERFALVFLIVAHNASPHGR